MKKAFRKILLFTLMAAFLCMALPSCAAAGAQTEVQALFINVGKADAALFWLGDQRYLVDTGHKNSHEHLIRVLDAYGVDHLDGVIVTHTDKDHAGGLKKLLKSGVQVDMLYAGALHSEKSLEKHPVYEASDKYGVPVTWLSAGQTIDAGNGCAFEVVGPLTQDDENENNNSLVMYLTTPEGEMLLTGDMEWQEETELIEAGLIRRALVLKVAHHGDNDATTKPFAMLVRPEWAIISTSTEDEPDTPDSRVLTRLWQLGCTTAETQTAEVGIMITLRGGKADAQQIDWQ